MMVAKDVGDAKESAMHQSLLLPDKSLAMVVVMSQCLQMGLVDTELPYTIYMVHRP